MMLVAGSGGIAIQLKLALDMRDDDAAFISRVSASSSPSSTMLLSIYGIQFSFVLPIFPVLKSQQTRLAYFCPPLCTVVLMCEIFAPSHLFLSPFAREKADSSSI